jgi:hypothetical protein
VTELNLKNGGSYYRSIAQRQDPETLLSRYAVPNSVEVCLFGLTLRTSVRLLEMKQMQRRLPVFSVGVVSLVYGLLTVPRAMHRPFWFDEMSTWHVAQQPSLRAIIEMLRLGVDSEMPLIFFIVRASHMLFGTGYLATRLPMLIGFWLMLLGVFVFLNRRLPLPYALVGMIFPMLTFAWPYAFEARAYGVALGAAAITLVAWQNVGLNYRRTASLIAIAIGLAMVLGAQPVGSDQSRWSDQPFRSSAGYAANR